MRILITGITGYVGGALVPRLEAEGHELRGLARDPSRALAEIPVVRGDVTTGAGLDEALEGIDVAYYLIHSMETASNGGFAAREEEGARRFAEAAARAGVRRTVYLGGILPAKRPVSPHMASRLRVEEILLEAVPDSVAFRASIVVGARSRPFRFLVRLVTRTPFIPLPPWGRFRTQPVDERDVLDFLARAAAHGEGGSFDIAGPDVVTYGEMIEGIRDALMIGRPRISLPISLTPVASQVAAAIAGEDPALIGPLMGSLGSDILPRDMTAPGVFGVRLHGFERAVNRALREWEELEPGSVAAR
jgi:uncharacterized protein YbjT (DUF2867 family)